MFERENVGSREWEIFKEILNREIMKKVYILNREIMKKRIHRHIDKQMWNNNKRIHRHKDKY